jgi:hypothetical protein
MCRRFVGYGLASVLLTLGLGMSGAAAWVGHPARSEALEGTPSVIHVRLYLPAGRALHPRAAERVRGQRDGVLRIVP